MSDFTVADLVAEFLDRIGVDTAFGIISVHNIPMMDAIRARNRIRMIPSRGEAGGAHMADGYARVTGRMGVLITSTGPGAANAVGGLVEARFASTPVLHITGQSRTPHLGRGMGTTHDVDNQLGMLAASGKAAFRVPSAAEALGTLTRAATAARTAPCGPVSVEIPIDIQRTSIPRPEALDYLKLPLPDLPKAPDSVLDALADRVRASRRPMLWVGNGAGSASAQVSRLLDLGFGMVCSWNGRGVVSEDHPMNLGGLNGGGVPMIEEFYAGCDLMLVCGSRLRGHETIDFSLKLPKPLVQIDVDPTADGRTYPNDQFILGDVAQVLAGLADRLRDWTSEPAFSDDFARMKTGARKAFVATLGPYQTFSEQLRAALPRDTVFARDVTINHSTWGNRLFPLHDARSNVYPVGAGIGQGLSLAIGAAIGAEQTSSGRRTLCMTGDGGFMLNLGELWTAVQERPNLVIMVMNDAGYGVIRHIQDATGAGRAFETLTLPNLADLATTAGLPFYQIADVETFGPTVAEAISRSGPVLVEIDMTAIGPHPPYFPYGPKAVPVD
ncbi:MAG: thiamine pyrophosphate-binding protein [Pseudomonadota bacterium]